MKKDLVLKKSNYYLKASFILIINPNHKFIIIRQIQNSLIREVYLEVKEVFSKLSGQKVFLKEG
jgi:hypothetical protein